jgi:hypothetical protein
VSTLTIPAVTVKLPTVCPSATTAFVGTLAAADLLLVSATVAPPAGAGPDSVTVAAAVEPEAIVDTGNTSDFTYIKLDAADCDVPLAIA